MRLKIIELQQELKHNNKLKKIIKNNNIETLHCPNCDLKLDDKIFIEKLQETFSYCKNCRNNNMNYLINEKDLILKNNGIISERKINGDD